MPTELKILEEEQHALTIVDNNFKEKDSLSDFLEEIYDSDSGQLIYREDIVPDAGELIDMINEEVESGKAYMPPEDRKLLFGWFVDMADFTEAWCDSFIDRAIELMRRLEPKDSSYQHHVICLIHEVRSLNEDDCKIKAEIFVKFAEKVKKCAEDGLFISQSIFILRKNVMEDYNSQERCIARLLYLMSRKEKAEVAKLSASRSFTIGMVKGAEYFEEQKARCEEKIRELQGWLYEDTDPDLERLQSKIIEIIESKLYTVNEQESIFNRSITYYPISKDDYVGNIIKGYKPDWERIKPFIRINKDRFISEKTRELMSNMDEEVSGIMDMVENDYHYTDYCLLKDLLDSGMLYATIVETLRSKKRLRDNTSDEQRIVSPVFEYVKRSLEPAITKTDIEKDKRERLFRMKKGELISAGEYDGLRDCFSRIIDKVQPGYFKGIQPFDVLMTALVSGNCVREWDKYRLGIKDCPLAYGCSALAPYEIAVLTAYQMVDLDPSSDHYKTEKFDREQALDDMKERLLSIIS